MLKVKLPLRKSTNPNYRYPVVFSPSWKWYPYIVHKKTHRVSFVLDPYGDLRGHCLEIQGVLCKKS